jgi:hypothetical protein
MFDTIWIWFIQEVIRANSMQHPHQVNLPIWLNTSEYLLIAVESIFDFLRYSPALTVEYFYQICIFTPTAVTPSRRPQRRPKISTILMTIMDLTAIRILSLITVCADSLTINLVTQQKLTHPEQIVCGIINSLLLSMTIR